MNACLLISSINHKVYKKLYLHISMQCFHEFMSSVQTQCDYTNTHKPVQINYHIKLIINSWISNLETFHIAPMVQHYLQYTVYMYV